jgi:hypothetical protein
MRQSKSENDEPFNYEIEDQLVQETKQLTNPDETNI